MTFGEALEVLKKGGVIKRQAWRDKWKTVWMIRQIALCREGMSYRIPQPPMKDESDTKLNVNPLLLTFNELGEIETWTPMVSDLLSEDWVSYNKGIVDEDDLVPCTIEQVEK